MFARRSLLACGLAVAALAAAQPADVNYDESKVPKYALPDPLRLSDGRRVASRKEWFERRRPEILRLFESNVYGRCPAPRVRLRWETASS